MQCLIYENMRFKKKVINIKVFNMILKYLVWWQIKIKPKQWQNIFNMTANANSTICNSYQKWNNKTCQCEYKTCRTCKKIIAGILADVFVRYFDNFAISRLIGYK